MTSPKTKAKNIFKKIRGFGFTPTDINYRDGYFLFDHGKDMVVHFHIKECKGWLFGIWWDLEDENKFQFFGQYERDIDKFKPTASTFVADNLTYSSKSKDLLNEVGWEIQPILKFIRKHPYVAWAYDCGYPRDCWDYLTDWEARIKFYKDWYEFSFKRPLLEKKFTKKYLKLVKLICDGRLVNYQIIDHSANGDKCWPRFHIVCDGVVGEDLKPGFYTIDLASEISPELYLKTKRYDENFGKYYLPGLEFFDDRLGFSVRKSKKS